MNDAEKGPLLAVFPDLNIFEDDNSLILLKLRSSEQKESLQFYFLKQQELGRKQSVLEKQIKEQGASENLNSLQKELDGVTRALNENSKSLEELLLKAQSQASRAGSDQKQLLPFSDPHPTQLAKSQIHGLLDNKNGIILVETPRGNKTFYYFNEKAGLIELKQNDENTNRHQQLINIFDKFDGDDKKREATNEELKLINEINISTKHLTIESIKKSMVKNNITNEAFQNKLLHCLIQTKLGLPHKIGTIVSKVLGDGEIAFPATQNQTKVNLNVKDRNTVILEFKSGIDEPISQNDDDESYEAKKAFDISVKVKITPQTIEFVEFKFTKVSNNQHVKDAFNELKNQQINFFRKIFDYIKSIFTKDSRGIIEKPSQSPVSTQVVPQEAASPALSSPAFRL
ncbi:MAG: hypothetical protein H2069_07745 [Legionella sp.]|nr:hypothetical protein [Legionella sp.]